MKKFLFGFEKIIIFTNNQIKKNKILINQKKIISTKIIKIGATELHEYAHHQIAFEVE